MTQHNPNASVKENVRARKIRKTGKQRAVKAKTQLNAGVTPLAKQMASLLKPRLQKSTVNYIKSMINPYDTPAGACAPDKIARRSARFKSFVKGQLTTGTADMGFVAAYPLSMAYGDSVCVSASSSTFTGTTIRADTTQTGVNGFSGNSTLSTTDIVTKDYGIRLVGMGIRIKNINPTLDVGGFVVGLYEPNDGSLFGAGAQDLRAYSEVNFIVPSHSKWIHVEFSPVNANQFAFSNLNPTTSTTIPHLPIGLVVIAPTSAPQSFVFEAYCIFEAIGKLDGLQDVHVDPLGQAACLEVMASLDGGASEDWIEHVPAIIRETSDALTKISGASLPLLMAMGT
jgi:hypothetical protein